MFNFTPLLGAQSSSPASQSLLELDGGIKVLVDVGWNEDFDSESLKELERQIPTISIVLLTHATVAHLGAFAHCCKHFPLFRRIPVYATTPVISLGRTLLQDLYASTPLAASIIPTAALSEAGYSFAQLRERRETNFLLQPPTAEEIAGYFSLIHPLKYSQPHQPLPSPFSPPLNGLTITAYNAGHTLGGTLWHIQHGLESIVYSVDWNQARENILAGAAWLGGIGGAEIIEQLRRPTAMICSSRGAERIAIAGGKKKRDEVLINTIRRTISNGGSVVIPSDSSARVLELTYLLEHAWRSDDPKAPSSLRNAKLYLASKTCGATMRFARSMFEWMDDSIVREFEGATGGQAGRPSGRGQDDQAGGSGDQNQAQTSQAPPFDFRFLKLLERKSQVERAITAKPPKVIIASDTSLQWGFSKEALKSFANDSRNLIILTERTQQNKEGRGALASSLWKLWEGRRGEKETAGPTGSETAVVVPGNGQEVQFEDAQAVGLQGDELNLYQQYLAQKRQLQNTLQPDTATAMESSADVVDDQSSTTSESTDDLDAEYQGKVLNTSATMAHSRNKLGLSDAELGVNVLLRKRGVHDFDVRGKKGRDKTFPFVAKRRRFDDFGDLIRSEEYLRAEERDEQDGEDMRGGPVKNQVVGQKRKWDEVVTQKGAAGRRASNGQNRRRKSVDGDMAGKSHGSKQDQGDSASEASDTESDYEPAEAVVHGPAKAVISHEVVRLNLGVAFVDFAGLHDKRSLQMLIPLIRPRKLILVSGDEAETMSLAADCRTLLGAQSGAGEGSHTEVHTPVVGDTIDGSVETNAWTLKLSTSLVKRLHWQKVKGLGVVAITGQLQPAFPETEVVEENAKKKPKLKSEESDSGATGAAVAHSQGAQAAPILDVIPTSLAAATRTVAQPLHVGDLRLADLRKLMQAAGYTAEFRGEGTLLIDGAVTVRKSGTGKIEVEGAASLIPEQRRQTDSTFYAVRKKIYEGLAIVAGG